MVALHNRRLTAKDIFPDALWTDADWHRKLAEYEDEVAREGLPHPEAFFEARNRLAAYQRRTSPGLRRHQEIMRRIYPGRPAPAPLTREEIDYLLDRLFGANDPVGQALRKKLQSWG